MHELRCDSGARKTASAQKREALKVAGFETELETFQMEAELLVSCAVMRGSVVHT